MRSVVPDYDTRYAYGADGNRAAKWTSTKLSETLYFNTMWTWHIDKGLSQEQQGQYSKHIYLGETRIVTKQTSDLEESYGQSEELRHQYYYHPDHLGSAQLITDYEGNEYQRIEYTPYGELWVEKKTANEKGMRYLPYKFTAKEQDEETGLYYYGARYLDAKYSRWLSADPAVGEYIPVAPTDDNARKHNEKLPGMGGVFNVVNFQLYHYAGNNPVKYVDPDGRTTYYDDYGRQTSDPYAVTGKKMGETPYLSALRAYEKIKSTVVNANLMGKKYNDTGDIPFVCTTFVKEVLVLLKLDVNSYLPGGQKVKDSINKLTNELIKANDGENPSEGLYVFYHLYDDGENGHTGFVYFDVEGNATILHNGGGKTKNVNEYIRDNRDFATWFLDNKKNPVYYKKINLFEE